MGERDTSAEREAEIRAAAARLRAMAVEIEKGPL